MLAAVSSCTGEKRHQVLDNLLEAGALNISFVGAVVAADAVRAVSDIGCGPIGSMTSILLMLPIVRELLMDYDRQREPGLDPHLDPRPPGTGEAKPWEAVDPVTLTGPGAVVEGGPKEREPRPTIPGPRGVALRQVLE